jgi:hypothetical protein
MRGWKERGPLFTVYSSLDIWFREAGKALWMTNICLTIYFVVFELLTCTMYKKPNFILFVPGHNS